MKRLTTEEFIIKSKSIHKDEYDYSLVEYENNHTKIKIICKKHGVFEQIPSKHINQKQGCPKCYGSKRKTMDVFINESEKIHNKEYDYSLVEYINNETKVKIICKKHGIFEQRPINHIYKNYGCPICSESKGEINIKNILEKNNIIFVQQKRFNDCRNKKPLPFDFYLPNHNFCIEFDGRQHFESIDRWGGLIGYEERIKIDEIKNEYCEKNNIKLLRIKYSDNIQEKINAII